MKSNKYILYGKKQKFLRDQRAGNVGPSCPIATGFTSSRHLVDSAIIIRGRPLGITGGGLAISKKKSCNGNLPERKSWKRWYRKKRMHAEEIPNN